MKKIFVLSSTLLLTVSTFAISINHPKEIDAAIKVSGCNYVTKLATEIDLSDSTEQEIRNYYSDLNDLSAEELQGNNLLKNLKPILFNMNYFSYDNVWNIYEITDRDWSLSPANETQYGTFDANSNTISKYEYGKDKNNPYVHTLYRDRFDESGRIREWGDHTAKGTNREHVWCQSRGFKADSGANGPAGTDVHHLISGDGRVNQTHHNNNPYGYVAVQDEETKKFGEQIPYIKNNKRGTALHTFAGLDESNVVFEPQDSDKGDIARACFYMVARYNNLSGVDEISQYEPNLQLANYATSNGTSEISSATKAVSMGILQDLLEWNKLDPVDDYEIHRNNLIYKNYQGNRNPFIDFPEWADYIWGTSINGTYDSTVKGSANPKTDKIAEPTEPVKPSDTPPSNNNQKLDMKMIIIIGAVALVVVIILIIIFVNLSKKNKKKVLKTAKKVVKKSTKKRK